MESAFRVSTHSPLMETKSARLGAADDRAPTRCYPYRSSMFSSLKTRSIHTPFERGGHCLCRTFRVELLTEAATISRINTQEKLSETLPGQPDLDIDQRPVGQPLLVLPVMKLEVSPLPKFCSAVTHAFSSPKRDCRTPSICAQHPICGIPSQCPLLLAQHRGGVPKAGTTSYSTIRSWKEKRLRRGKWAKYDPVRRHKLCAFHRPDRSGRESHGIHQRKKLLVDSSTISLVDANENLCTGPFLKPCLNINLQAGSINRAVGNPPVTTAGPGFVLVATFFHKRLTTQSANRGLVRKVVALSLSLRELSAKPARRSWPRNGHNLAHQQ